MNGIILGIVGPTASGKSAVALELASRLPAEIVNCDSRQVYRYMDIGTAKPTPLEQARVPHHALDLVDPDEPFTVFDYKKIADRVIEDIHRRGRLPILVGGTGLYLRAVMDDLSLAQVPPDYNLRRQLAARAKQEGPEVLHRELFDLDPLSASRIHPNDLRRTIRALEIYHRTGRTKSSFTDKDSPRRRRTLLIGLGWERASLYRRANERTRRIFQNGFEAEVERLVRLGLGHAPVVGDTIGYRQMLACLRGEMTKEEAEHETAKATRRYAKRQMSWFRAEPKVHWLQAEGRTPQALADEIESVMQAFALVQGMKR